MASAENVTFAVIGPHEYELPVNFKDFDAFVQYGEANFTNQFYNSAGKLGPAPASVGGSQNLYIGLTKVVRFVSFDSLPNVGFAPEAIIPEVGLRSGNSATQYGIGDPIFGGATWIKPNKDSTFGFQTFITAPIGTPNQTSHYYSNLSTILYDYQFKHFDIDGQTGGQFFSDQRTPGMDRRDVGTKFFSSLRVGYKLNEPSIPIEPFFAVDYQFQTGQKDLVTGLPIAGSSEEDLALGAGGVITISDKYSFTVRYSRSVTAINDFPTNSVWIKFVSILP